MSKRYDVIWAAAAENDLLKIVEYIAAKYPGDAFSILKKIKKEVSGLYFSPERCRIAPELYDQGIILYREMIIPPWRVIYRVSDSQVFVLCLLDSRQNIEDILLKRLIT